MLIQHKHGLMSHKNHLGLKACSEVLITWMTLTLSKSQIPRLQNEAKNSAYFSQLF